MIRKTVVIILIGMKSLEVTPDTTIDMVYIREPIGSVVFNYLFKDQG